MENATNASFICETSYTGKIYLSGFQINLLIAVNALVMVPNFVLNALVIYTLYITEQLQSISLKLILLLSLSDCALAGVTQVLFTIMLAKYSDNIYCNFETAVQFLAIFLTHTSGYIIALIGLDRYARLKYLNRYSGVMTKKRLIILVMVVVLLSLLQATAYVVGTQLNFFAKAKKVTVAIDGLIALSVLLIYILTIKVIRDHRSNANFQSLLENVNNTVTKIASRILLAIVIFYVSYIVISMVHSMKIANSHGSVKQWLEFTLLLGYVLTYCNSVVNALIFLNANKKAKLKLMRLIGRKIQYESSVITDQLHTDSYVVCQV